MRGVVFLGERKLELQEFPDPTPGPGEVVLAIKASGMCGSDLHPYRAVGNAAAALGLGAGGPVIAGHEPCGVVAAVGAGVAADFAPVGARVMNHHYKGCGRCKHCRVGWSQLCRNGITVYGMTGHGGHAPFMKVPAFTLVPLPDELSFEEGAAISCGTGTAYGALKRLDVSGRDTLAVFGQGPVGLSRDDARPGHGRPRHRRGRLRRAPRARPGVRGGRGDRLERHRSGRGHPRADPRRGRRDDHGLHGRARGARGRGAKRRHLGTRRPRRRGRRPTTFDVSQHLLRRQLTIHASWTFSAMGQAECARFIVDRKIPLKKLLTHRFKLDEADRAYKLFDTQTTGKGVFVF